MKTDDAVITNFSPNFHTANNDTSNTSSKNVTSLSASCLLMWTQQKTSYSYGRGGGGLNLHTFLTSALDEGKRSPSQRSHFSPTTEYSPSPYLTGGSMVTD